MSAPGSTDARTEQFPSTGPAEIEVHVGAGAVVVELTDDATTVDVTVSARPGSWWSQGLSGVLAALGVPAPGATPTTPVEEPDHARVHAQHATHVGFEAGRQRVVVRGPQVGAERSAALDVRVAAPTGSRVRVRTGSASVQVVGTPDAVDVGAGSGDVTVQDARGALEVRTGSGEVRTGHLHRGGRIRTGSGDLAVDATSGDLDLLTGSGDLRIGIAAGVLAELDVSSGSGDVRSELPVVGAPGDGPAVHVRARTGSGGALVHAGR